MAPKKQAAALGGVDGKHTMVFGLALIGPHMLKDSLFEGAFNAAVSEGARFTGVFDAAGRSPLMVAAAHGNTRFMRILFKKARVPVDERSPRDGVTALHCCVNQDVEVECPEAVALLLDAGADIEAVDGAGVTPLCLSVANHRVAPTRLLIDRGADVNRRVGGGWTPLILGTEKEMLDDARWPVFQELLRRSTVETRRATGATDARLGRGGMHSAVDFLVACLADIILTDSTTRGTGAPAEEARIQVRCRAAIAELLESGAPVLPHNEAAAKRAANAPPVQFFDVGM